MRLIQITCFVICCVSSFSYGDITSLYGQRVYEPLPSGRYVEAKYQQWLDDWFLPGLYREYSSVPGMLTLGRPDTNKKSTIPVVPKLHKHGSKSSKSSAHKTSKKRGAELNGAGLVRSKRGAGEGSLATTEETTLPTLEQIKNKYKSVNWEDVISDVKPADFPTNLIWWMVCMIHHAMEFDARDSVRRSFHQILRRYDTALPLLVQISFQYFLSSPYYDEKHKQLLKAWMEFMEVKYSHKTDWYNWVTKKKWEDDTRPGRLFAQASMWDTVTGQPTARGYKVLQEVGGNIDWLSNEMMKPEKFRSYILWEFIVLLYYEEDDIIIASDFNELCWELDDLVLQNTFVIFLDHVFFKKNNIPTREINMFGLWLDQALECEIKIPFDWREELIQQRARKNLTPAAE